MFNNNTKIGNINLKFKIQWYLGMRTINKLRILIAVRVLENKMQFNKAKKRIVKSKIIII